MDDRYDFSTAIEHQLRESNAALRRQVAELWTLLRAVLEIWDTSTSIPSIAQKLDDWQRQARAALRQEQEAE